MAFSFKGRKYNLATIRKSVVGFLGSLITFLSVLALLVNDIVPTEWVIAIGTVGAILTGVVTFLVTNARLIDRFDGFDPEDAV